jgi:hypothetical protein
MTTGAIPAPDQVWRGLQRSLRLPMTQGEKTGFRIRVRNDVMFKDISETVHPKRYSANIISLLM